MSAYSRTKGHNFERRIAAQLRAVLPKATIRRSSQADAAYEPDVVIEGDAPELAKRLWLECQHSANPDPAAKLAQAERDAPAGRLPIAVTHRTGARRDPIVATMRLTTACHIMLDAWSPDADEIIVHLDWQIVLDTLRREVGA